jgi:hypothetical protein
MAPPAEVCCSLSNEILLIVRLSAECAVVVAPGRRFFSFKKRRLRRQSFPGQVRLCNRGRRLPPMRSPPTSGAESPLGSVQSLKKRIQSKATFLDDPLASVLVPSMKDTSEICPFSSFLPRPKFQLLDPRHVCALSIGSEHRFGRPERYRTMWFQEYADTGPPAWT